MLAADPGAGGETGTATRRQRYREVVDVANDKPTCEVGQAEPCGEPANHMIAVTTVRDTAWATEQRQGGVVFLCEQHATNPAADWGNW